MSWIAGVAMARDTTDIEARDPGFWRELRRFNLPVKLALGAARVALGAARDPSGTFIVSLAPCHPGSPELGRAALGFETNLLQTGRAAAGRVNPTYTLHAIDNLALSSLAQVLGNHGHCVGVGGAPGQAWAGLEMVLERLADGAAEDALLLAGDQDGVGPMQPAAGVALLFSARPRPLDGTDRMVRVVGVERRRELDATPRPDAIPDSALGLVRWIETFAGGEPGRHGYRVPAVDGDGIDHITVVTELR